MDLTVPYNSSPHINLKLILIFILNLVRVLISGHLCRLWKLVIPSLCARNIGNSSPVAVDRQTKDPAHVENDTDTGTVSLWHVPYSMSICLVLTSGSFSTDCRVGVSWPNVTENLSLLRVTVCGSTDPVSATQP